MNKSNLAKVATYLFTLLILGVVTYSWYHNRRAAQAKEALHDLENKLGGNTTIEEKIKHYQDFVQTWDSTLASSTACYRLGGLYMEQTEKDYDNAIKYLEKAKMTKGGIVETERHMRLAACYQHTNKLKKALTAYDHVIAHAPAYGCKIDALWAKAEIYATGPLQNQEKQSQILQQITEIPLDGINGDERAMQIVHTAESILASISQKNKQERQKSSKM